MSGTRPQIRRCFLWMNGHQGRFTRAVLTQQCVDLTPPQLQRDVVVCHNAGELFSDIEHFNNVFRLHYEEPSFPNLQTGLLYTVNEKIARK